MRRALLPGITLLTLGGCFMSLDESRWMGRDGRTDRSSGDRAAERERGDAPGLDRPSPDRSTGEKPPAPDRLPPDLALTTTKVVLTSGSTWPVPAGVTSLVSVECWGAGGGAAGMEDASFGAGGGGAYARISSLAVQPGSQISYSVGKGGASSTSGAAGTDGGDTWFSSGATVLARGGRGSLPDTTTWLGGKGGSAAASVGALKRSGGDGGTAASGWGGGGGGAAGSELGDGANGSDSTNSGGAGGACPGGGPGGSAGQTGPPSGPGQPGYSAALGGGGGGGGGGNDTGVPGGQGGAGGVPGGGAGATGKGKPAVLAGSGGDGQIVITYYKP